MSGWLLAWSRSDAPLDSARWLRSIAGAVRYGGTATDFRADRFALGAWRRNAGEFPMSGRLVSVAGAQMAWVGQCVEDTGDVTESAMSRMAAKAFDGDAVAGLNGPFAAAIVRTDPFDVRVVTDRHRHYPVYLYRGGAATVASTEIRCLVPWLDQPELDRDAVDMLLRCGELIDRQTLLKNVEMLASGSVLADSGRGATERRYWFMRSDGHGTLQSNAEELGARLKVGVRRLEAATSRPGITLSGGLDSRIILDLCRHPERVPSFTWGLPGCRDIKCASIFATLVKSPQVVRHWDPHAFPPLWSRGVDLTGGSCGVESMFMLPFLPLLASECDVVFNGLAGDVILGGNWLKHSWLSESSIERLGRAVWRWRVPIQHDMLVDRLVRRGPGAPAAREQWVDSVVAREGARPIERLNDWLLENRIFRTTNCGSMLLRSGVESHSPFFDRDFIDALSRVPQELKFKHRLYLAVMNRVAARAASVRWQRTNVKPARGYYANLAAMAFQSLATRAAKPLGIHPFSDLAVADPAGWFRNAWRRPAEEIILSDRFRKRELADPDVVREILDSHMSGADHSRQLSVLIAVELFSRLMIDGEAA